MKTALALLLAAFSTSALAKLPPPTPEAQAKAAETAARAAWTAKVDGYKLCQSQDKTATIYFAAARAAGKTVHEPAASAPCADPGPFAYSPPASKQ